MDLNLREDELAELKHLLKQKHVKISARRIKAQWNKIENSQQIFPTNQQRALLVQMLDNYATTKKKVVTYMERLDNVEEHTLPVTYVLGALAEDWPGMSNSILGIVHHKQHNVLFMKGFTLDYEDRALGVVILCFRLNTPEEYEIFIKEKKELLLEIKDAAQGSTGKYMLLTDEAVKYEIYNKILKKIKELYHSSGLLQVIEESNEVLKFVSSRSREYLEERKVKDLAHLILDNYIYQNMIRSGATEEVIKIKNFKTKNEELTGITFVCKEDLFSIEDFLKTLDYIVPGHIIRHHKSFVTRDGILVYRIEIVDHYEKPLDGKLIRSIESSMEKSIAIACNKKFTKLKSVGGFEHYARAIIPFLQDELQKTKLTQVFIHVEGKTEFLIDIKLVIVGYKSRKKRNFALISRLSMVPGFEINSTIPPKIHQKKIEVTILKLRVNLSEFSSIREIYNSLKSNIKNLYGDIRDFDEGFRDIYIRILNQLLETLPHVDAALVREIYFNVDELCRIETSTRVLAELIRLCNHTVELSQAVAPEKTLYKYLHMESPSRTLLVVSHPSNRRIINRIISRLKSVELYFTKIEWDQRSYLLLILTKNKSALTDDIIEEMMSRINGCCKQ